MKDYDKALLLKKIPLCESDVYYDLYSCIEADIPLSPIYKVILASLI